MCAARSEELDLGKYAQMTPVKAGFLMQPPFGGAGWLNRYCKVYDDGLVMTLAKMDDVAPKQFFRLTADYFVQDSRIREHAFMLSNFSKTYFLGAGNQTTKLTWMQAMASVIRALPEEPEEQQSTTSAVPQQRVVIQRVVKTRPAPAPAPVAPAAPAGSREAEADAMLAQLMAQFDSGLTPEEQARRQARNAAGIPQAAPRALPTSNAQAQLRLRQEQEARAQREAEEERARKRADEARRAEALRQQKEEEARRTEALRREQQAAAEARRIEQAAAKKKADLLAAEQARQRRLDEERIRDERMKQAAMEERRAQEEAALQLAARAAEVEKRKQAEEMARLQAEQATLAQEEEARRRAAADKPAPPPPRPAVAAPASQPPPPPPRAAVPAPPPRPAAPPAPAPAAPAAAAVDTDTINREAMRNMWDSKSKQSASEMATNPFSQNFDAAAAKANVKHGDQYGRPVAGSKTEERAKAAQNWVEQAIDKLISVITEIGKRDSQGRPFITFGELFIAYQDISDTLVGIMLRAKKRGRLEYEGDMLFQGLNDGVVITVLG